MSAIPSAMRLEPKPEAINAYRRRCYTNATSANPYPSRGTIKIPLDTAFPGSMLDTSQTQLSFHLNISNSNPFVDFLNLPKIGANIVFKELRIMVNGNALEKNPRYGLTFEDAMNKMGMNTEPFEFFSENQWCPTESKFHCNMIKPSMVDCMGNPMYRSQLFRDRQQIDQLFFGRADTTTTAPVNNAVITVTASKFGNILQDAAVADAANVFSMGTLLGRSTGILCNATNAFSADPNTANANRVDQGTIHAQCAVLATPLDAITTPHQDYNRGNHTLYTPADWPFFQPGIAKPQKELSKTRWQDIIQFYSNCKNIPIGMYKTWSSATSVPASNIIESSATNYLTCFNQNTSEFVPSLSTNTAVTSFRIVTPLLSGILGLLADKFFPDMLVAAGKMWIELDLQPKEYALQLLMDPCRRIPGTIRDYVPYAGRLAGTSKETAYPAAAADLAAHHCLLGKQLILPTRAAAGTNLAKARNARLCYSEGACLGEIFIGLRGRPGAAALGFQTFQQMSAITNEDASVALSGGTTGIPIPQYFLSTSPWTMKSSGSTVTYARETQGCYGTYLRHATAQTRRTQSSTNCKDITLSYSSYDTDYYLTNVGLYTEQIIVPDEIASQLLLSARNGAIAYHTNFVNATYNNAPTTESQNLLLTVTGASVNSVTFLFQSNVQLSGTEAFAYNSVATYNPWTRLDFSATDGVDYDVGGKYTLYNPLTTKNSLGLNLYLKIGNELIPRQGINSIPELLMETQKGFQTLSDYSIQLDMKTYVIPTIITNTSESYMQYDVLRDGFFSCFVEAKALDDQTLTGNPYLNIQGYGVHSAAIAPIAARRCESSFQSTNEISPTSGVKGVLNLFRPLDGNYRLCFNLATFETQNSARCGTPIVNNQLFLQGDLMYFMAHKVDGTTPTVCVTAVYEQDAKIVFEQGGNCLSFI